MMTATETVRTLSDLTAGDSVTIRFRYGCYQPAETATVRRVTATLIVVDAGGQEMRFRREDGDLHGRGCSRYHTFGAYLTT